MATLIPQMALVRQHFPASPPVDVEGLIARDLPKLGFRSGERIAVGVGSRGIADLQRVVATVIQVLKGTGAQPFVIPAMGSHGGATPAGQREVLTEYGITEASVGAPIDDSVDVERVGTSADGVPVFCAISALRADGIVLINRVKPHTDFGGSLGSGIIKMSVIGLGKQPGAASTHTAVARLGYERVLRGSSKVVLGRAAVRGGVALVEDAHHKLAVLEVMRTADFDGHETLLLERAGAAMARLPFDELDLLIVDRMGKNISGAGMDPNVIGNRSQGYSNSLSEKPDYKPAIARIFVRDLDPASHGNACGLGMADFTTARLVRAIDQRSSFMNALTSLSVQSVKIPIHLESDREVLEAALGTLALPDPSRARVARIGSTLDLETLEVSDACLGGGLEVLHPAAPLRFDAVGNLLPLGAPTEISR